MESTEFDFDLNWDGCCAIANCHSEHVQLHATCEFCGEDCTQCEKYLYKSTANCVSIAYPTVCHVCKEPIRHGFDIPICEQCLTMPKRSSKKKKLNDETDTQSSFDKLITTKSSPKKKSVEFLPKLPTKSDDPPKILIGGKSPLIGIRTIDQLKMIKFKSRIGNNYCAFVPKSFWDLWNEKKKEIKALGFYMKKIEKKFYLFKKKQKKERALDLFL